MRFANVKILISQSSKKSFFGSQDNFNSVALANLTAEWQKQLKNIKCG
jgi:hypothetical protein